MTYDENSKDHYELTKILFDNQMVGKDFLGTFNGKNYNRMKGVLLALKDFKEMVIAGGCHAYFGMYGAQDGDGRPEISNEEQIALTVDAVSEMMIDHE